VFCAAEDSSSEMLMIQKYIQVVIHNRSDEQKLQSIVNPTKNWSDEWLLELNIDNANQSVTV